MEALEQKVRALLHAAQQERKSALVRARVDTTYQVGAQVNLQIKELLDTHEESTLEGAFRVAAVAGPNTYTPTLQARFKCNPAATDDLLKLCFLRVGSTTWVRRGNTWWSNFSTARRGRRRTNYLVRWQGHASTDDAWGVQKNTPRPARSVSLSTRLPHPAFLRPSRGPLLRRPSTLLRPPCCPPRLRSRPTHPHPAGVWRPLSRRASALPSSLSRSRPAPLLVIYRTATAAFVDEVDTLLDAAIYASRWVSPALTDP